MDAKIEVQDFIARVHSHSEIWDKSNRDHHNRYALEKTWAVIARETNITVKEAQTKWKSLRDYYRKELRRLTQTYGSDFDEGSVFETIWPYFKYLTFLKTQFQPKRSDADSLQDPLSVPKNQESSLDFMTVKIEGVDGQDPDEDSLDMSGSDSLQFERGEGLHDRIRSQVSLSHGSILGKRRKVARTEDADSPQVTITAGPSTENEYDEDRHFFESLLPHTKRIVGLDKMLFRGEVQKLIIKYAYSERNAVSGSNGEISRSGCYSADNEGL
uniref:Transcription factor Adf-1 n=1 Tax=Lygus hesperus TaxID=30085 RepID=A0A0A9WT09_LYGHE